MASHRTAVLTGEKAREEQNPKQSREQGRPSIHSENEEYSPGRVEDRQYILEIDAEEALGGYYFCAVYGSSLKKETRSLCS